MKKNITNVLLILASTFTATACSNIDYDGEYSKNGYYTGSNQISLNIKSEADTLRYYTFSDKPSDTLEHVMRIPVILTGKILDKPQAYKVKVDPCSTAKEGKKKKKLNDVYFLPANQSKASFGVTLLRKNLSEVSNDSIRLVLQLEPTSDLGLRFSKRTKITIEFNNVFLKPDYWNILEMWGIGEYHVAKHKKLLEYCNYDTNMIDDFFIKGNMDLFMPIYNNVLKVITYFNAHPDELKK